MTLNVFSCIYWPLHNFFGEMSIQVFCPFNKLVVFLLSCGSSFCILYARPLPDRFYKYFFSIFVGCLCTLLIMSLDMWKHSILTKSNVSYFFLCACAVIVKSKKSLPNPRSWRFTSLHLHCAATTTNKEALLPYSVPPTLFIEKV